MLYLLAIQNIFAWFSVHRYYSSQSWGIFGNDYLFHFPFFILQSIQYRKSEGRALVKFKKAEDAKAFSNQYDRYSVSMKKCPSFLDNVVFVNMETDITYSASVK